MNNPTTATSDFMTDEEMKREIDRMIAEMKLMDKSIARNHEQTRRLREESDKIHVETMTVISEMAARRH